MKNEKQVIYCYKCKKIISKGEGRYYIGGFKETLYSCIECYNKYYLISDREKSPIDDENHPFSSFKKNTE